MARHRSAPLAAVARRVRTGAPVKVYPPSIVSPEASVGADTVVGAFCFVAAGAVIGAGTRIQSHTSVWAGVVLGEDVFVGPGAMFSNVRRPRAAFPRAASGAGGARWDETHVGDGATIGAHATLVAPLDVGPCALVGAGAVVTHDVPAHAIVVGVPARVVGWACACGEAIAHGPRKPKRATCGRCGRVYQPAPQGGLKESRPLRGQSPSRASRSARKR